MRIATEVVTNMWMKQRLGGAVERVSEGESLGAALESAGDFPPMVLHMVASGEASGELDAMLTKVAGLPTAGTDAAGWHVGAVVPAHHAAGDGRLGADDRARYPGAHPGHESVGVVGADGAERGNRWSKEQQ